MSPMMTPHDSEQHDEFMDRCMSDDMMKKEMPDDEKRMAVCQTQWEERHEEGEHARYQHVLTMCAGAVWAILPTKLAAIMNLLAFRASGGRLTAEEIRLQIGAAARPQSRTAGTIAVLPLYGTLVPRGNFFNSSGATSIEGFTQLFRQALADPQIGGVLIDIDSPGGMVQAVDELAAEIYRARGIKPIVGLANNMACSAAYWVATACGELYMTPSAEVGSIGVVAMHEDISKLLEQQGVKVSLIHSSKYKVDGSPYAPLSDEAREYIKGRVDEYHGDFVAAVARGRAVPAGEVEERYGQGRVMGARQAKLLGMVDGVMTFDEVTRHMARQMKQKEPMKNMGNAASIDEALSRNPEAVLVSSDAIIAIGGMRAAFAGPTKPHKSKGIAANDTVWDGPGEVAKAQVEELHEMCAWEDSSGPDDDGDGHPDRKADYKFPHHRAGDHHLVPRGLHECAARRDQSSIPDGDKAGMLAHLANHYHQDLDQEAPWEREEAAVADLDLRRRRLELAER